MVSGLLSTQGPSANAGRWKILVCPTQSPTPGAQECLFACAVTTTGLGFSAGISIGHPIGATGAIITVKALYELQRIQGRYALVTMCIGGGQGIAAIFERM